MLTPLKIFLYGHHTTEFLALKAFIPGALTRNAPHGLLRSVAQLLRHYSLVDGRVEPQTYVSWCDSYTFDILVDVPAEGACSKLLDRLRKILRLVKSCITHIDVDRELVDCRPNGAVEALDKAACVSIEVRHDCLAMKATFQASKPEPRSRLWPALKKKRSRPTRIPPPGPEGCLARMMFKAERRGAMLYVRIEPLR